MQYTYLLVNLFIIFFPFLLSFEKKINFISKYKAFIPAILIANIILITWDYIATLRGDWSFNSKMIIGIYFAGLPLEEILFFFTAPYSLLFIYECVMYYIKDTKISTKGIFLVRYIGSVLLLSSFLFLNYYYTFTATLVLGLVLVIFSLDSLNILHSKNIYLTILIAVLPFIIINYVLTSIPVVIYSYTAFMGFRFTTIPLEDFLFNTFMVIIYTSLYTTIKRKLNIS